MRRHRYLGTTIMVAAGAIILAGGSASAAEQDGKGGTIEELVVVARKRAENLQDVPIAITALSGSQLEQRSVTVVNDLARLTPNVTFDRGTTITGSNGTSSLFIRGIGQSDFNNAVDPGVGIYIDGIYFGRAFGSVMDAVDLDHVEILRGPQGTLFGKNTIGGAINILSAMPDGQFGGYVDAAIGRFNERNVRGSVNFPITEGLAARASVSYRTRDGFTSNPIDHRDYDDVDSLVGRFVLRATPSDQVTLTTIVDGSRRRENGAAIHLSDVRPGMTVARLYPGIEAYQSGGTRTTYGTGTASLRASGLGDPYANFDGFGLSENIAYDLTPALTFTSITSYRGFESKSLIDGDGTPLTESAVLYSTGQHQFSQELRLNGSAFDKRLKWVAGLYFFEESVHEDYINRVFFGTLNITPNQIDQQHTISKAAYVDGTYEITDALSLSAGVRFSDDRKKFAGQSVFLNGTVWLPPGSFLADQWSSVDPRFSIDYKISPDVLVYASYAKGYKGGGFNPQITKPNDLQSFGPERSANYEVGAKTELLDRRLRINGDVFYTEYTGIQQRVSIPAGQFTCPAGTAPVGCASIINDASVRLRGAELEIQAAPTSQLELDFSAGYLDQKFTEIGPLLLATRVLDYSRKLPRSPTWTANAGAQYRIPVGSAGELSLRADYSYKSSYYLTVANQAHAFVDATGLLSARVAFKTTDERWEVALEGRNLTDELYVTSALDQYDTSGAVFSLYGEPRTWTLSARRRF